VDFQIRTSSAPLFKSKKLIFAYQKTLIKAIDCTGYHSGWLLIQSPVLLSIEPVALQNYFLALESRSGFGLKLDCFDGGSPGLSVAIVLPTYYLPYLERTRL
jgi:hypothetical protein